MAIYKSHSSIKCKLQPDVFVFVSVLVPTVAQGESYLVKNGNKLLIKRDSANPSWLFKSFTDIFHFDSSLMNVLFCPAWIRIFSGLFHFSFFFWHCHTTQCIWQVSYSNSLQSGEQLTLLSSKFWTNPSIYRSFRICSIKYYEKKRKKI